MGAAPCFETRSSSAPQHEAERGPRLWSEWSQACAHAFDEAHVDDLFVLDVALEDAGLAHHRAAGYPGFLADHAVLAPHLVAERAVECRLEVLERHGRELLLGDLGGLVAIGVEGFETLHH